jgi:AAA+ ATPase superfamily predicted ATPase
MENPFIVGKIITDTQLLCPRKTKSSEIIQDIKNHQNIYLTGERRVGKSSLITSLANDLEKSEKLLMIYVDFRSVASLADVQKRIVSSILKVAGKIKDMEWYLALFKKLKPQVTPAEDGTLEFSLGVQEAGFQDYFSLSEVFDFIEKTYSRHKCFVVFDEFQDILLLGDKEGESVLGMMRSRIQLQSKISYVFLGSQRSSMNYIFEDYNSSFYHQAMRKNIDRFEKEELFSYCSNLFGKDGRVLSSGVFERIYELTHGITGDVLKICHKTWNKTKPKDVIFASIVEESISEIASEFTSVYTDRVNGLTTIQRKFMRAFVLEDTLGLQSREFIKKYGLKSKDEIKNSLKTLSQQGVVYKYNESYEFFDPFFKFWLQRIYRG